MIRFDPAYVNAFRDSLTKHNGDVTIDMHSINGEGAIPTVPQFGVLMAQFQD